MTDNMGANMLRNTLRTAAIAAAASASFAASAAYDVDILPPASPIAQQIYDLHFAILWVCVVIFVVVFGAMFYSVFTHRKAAGAKAAHFHENTTVEIIWTVIPFVILIGMAYPATKTVLEMKDSSNPDLTIKVTAYQWAWEYDYLQDGVKFNSLLSTPRNADRASGAGRVEKKTRLPAGGRQAHGRAGRQEGAPAHHRERRDPRLVRAAARREPVRHPRLREGHVVQGRQARHLPRPVQPDLRQGARLHAHRGASRRPPRTTPPG